MAQNKIQSKNLLSRKIGLALGFAILAIGTGNSIAQNAEGPIQVSANEIDVQPQNNFATFTGNAEVIQDGTALRAEKFKVYYQNNGAGSSGGKIEKVISEGETFYVSATEKARGDKAVFDASTNILVFSGNVILTQGQNVLTGDELRVNTKTKQSIMKSSNGRVKGVFFPNQPNPTKATTTKPTNVKPTTPKTTAPTQKPATSVKPTVKKN
jgi:lipopolysaccharide export system protein LptA